jgi:hypothetical protein
MTATRTTIEDAIVVYESMFGSSRAIAFAIAQGLGCEAVSIADIGPVPPDVELLVAGAPTHVHGLSRPESRAEAVKWAADPARKLALEPGHERGMREWLAVLGSTPRLVATFDTRADMPQLFSGAASRSIEQVLVKGGATALEPPRSFLVDKRSHLVDGELERAFVWGRLLRALLATKAAAA